MISFIMSLIRPLVPPCLYFGWFGVSIYAMLKNAFWGLLFLTFLVPFPALFYALHQYPLGKDLFDILIFSVLIGIVLQKYGFPKTQNRSLIIFFLLFTYFELWMASLRYSLPLPITTNNYQVLAFKNYVEMILFYFIASSLTAKEEDQNKLVLVMCLVFLLIGIYSFRNFSAGDSFSYDRRTTGTFGTVGLGPNHIGAFAAHFAAFFTGMFLTDRNRKRRYFFLCAALFGLYPILFSYSRGAYIASLAALIFLGVTKKRILLGVVVVLIFSWTVVLPSSVVDRIEMTEDPNEQGRLDLWRLAFDLFQKNPITGVGYDGYALSVGGHELHYLTTDRTERLNAHQDAHNFYARTAAEHGVVGLFLFLALLFRSFRSGWRLYNSGDSPLKRSIGFGFTACVVALAITNIFGDRWSYFVMGTYFWSLFGIVDGNLCRQQAR